MNFGGLFNTLSMDIPISVVSGMVAQHEISEATEVLDLPP